MKQWIADWVAALRSGKYEQIKTWPDMWDDEGRLSALGVLCEINGCEKDRRDNGRLTDMLHKIAKQNSETDALRFSFSAVGFDARQMVNGYKDKYEDSSPYYIPIALTSKLDCNSPVQFLHYSRYDLIKDNSRFVEEVSIFTLDKWNIPFVDIADFIEENHPCLCFETARKNPPITRLQYNGFELILKRIPD
jgi:hypothetical protein